MLAELITASLTLGRCRLDKVFSRFRIFGGEATLDHLEKLKAAEHLILLAQIAELEPYHF